MKKRLFLSLFDWLIPTLAVLDIALLHSPWWRELLWSAVLLGMSILKYRIIQHSGDEERIRRYRQELVFYVAIMAFIFLMGLIHLINPG